ncbi:MAG: GGDEF domain-containing protein [Candidatus Geothermincolia bacterium]
MKYTRFEILAMVVGICAVVGTIIATISSTNTAADIVGQLMIVVVLFGGLHYGRKGALISFVIATGFYAIFAFGVRGNVSVGTATQIFILRTVVFAIVALVAGELNVRLKYLFIKLEHHDYVDDITTLYNAKYLAKLIEKYISEFDRYGSKFSLTNFSLNEEVLTPMKKKARIKVIKDLGYKIRGNIRGADEAARLEGTKFTVLFPNTNYDGATCATIRVKEKIAGYLDKYGLDTEDDNVIKTEIIEYPRDRDTIEVLAVNLQDSYGKEKAR